MLCTNKSFANHLALKPEYLALSSENHMTAYGYLAFVESTSLYQSYVTCGLEGSNQHPTWSTPWAIHASHITLSWPQHTYYHYHYYYDSKVRRRRRGAPAAKGPGTLEDRRPRPLWRLIYHLEILQPPGLPWKTEDPGPQGGKYNT